MMGEKRRTVRSETEAGTAPVATTREGISLRDLVLLEVPLSWQEGVAIVLEAIHALPDGGPCPDPALVTLSAIGETHALPGLPLHDAPVRAAASFLKELLASATMPPELRALIDRDSADTPAHAGLSDFVEALSYFERPNRRADVAAVHVRAHTLYLKASADQELARLRAKAAATTPPHAARQRVTSVPISARVYNWAIATVLWIVIAASLASLVVVALGVPLPNAFAAASFTAPELPLWPFAQSLRESMTGPLAQPPAVVGLTSPAGTPGAGFRSATVEARTSSMRSSRVDEPARSHTLSTASPVSAPLVAVSPEPARTAGASTASNSTASKMSPESPPVAPSWTPTEWSVSVRALTSVAELAERGLLRELEGVERDESLFSREDSDVSPALLVRPQLPAPGEGRATHRFELIVSDAGSVEQVRLISAAARLNDRMLIAAAKAWQFKPALKDGRPVRYRLELAITP